LDQTESQKIHLFFCCCYYHISSRACNVLGYFIAYWSGQPSVSSTEVGNQYNQGYHYDVPTVNEKYTLSFFGLSSQNKLLVDCTVAHHLVLWENRRTHKREGLQCLPYTFTA
jgi:hypothetical protein